MSDSNNKNLENSENLIAVGAQMEVKCLLNAEEICKGLEISLLIINHFVEVLFFLFKMLFKWFQNCLGLRKSCEKQSL